MRINEQEMLKVGFDLPSAIEYVEADGIVTNGSCLLDEIIITANGGDVTVKVYDGTNITFDQKATLLVKDGYTQNFKFGRGAIMDRGIYLAVTSTYTNLTIMFRQLPNWAII